MAHRLARNKRGEKGRSVLQEIGENTEFMKQKPNKQNPQAATEREWIWKYILCLKINRYKNGSCNIIHTSPKLEKWIKCSIAVQWSIIQTKKKKGRKFRYRIQH